MEEVVSSDVCQYGFLYGGDGVLCRAGVGYAFFVSDKFPDGVQHHIIDCQVLFPGIVNYFVFLFTLHAYVQDDVLVDEARLLCAPAH